MLAARPPRTLEDANKLLALSELLSSNVRTIIAEWAKESTVSQKSQKYSHDAGSDGAYTIPSTALHNAQRTVLGITGSLTELVSEPSLRILELGCQYWESRALFIAAERRVPDALALVSPEDGMSSSDLAKATGIEKDKLCKIVHMRTHQSLELTLQHGSCVVFAPTTFSASPEMTASPIISFLPLLLETSHLELIS
jgi:hypothetical protein